MSISGRYIFTTLSDRTFLCLFFPCCLGSDAWKFIQGNVSWMEIKKSWHNVQNFFLCLFVSACPAFGALQKNGKSPFFIIRTKNFRETPVCHWWITAFRTVLIMGHHAVIWSLGEWFSGCFWRMFSGCGAGSCRLCYSLLQPLTASCSFLQVRFEFLIFFCGFLFVIWMVGKQMRQHDPGHFDT